MKSNNQKIIKTMIATYSSSLLVAVLLYLLVGIIEQHPPVILQEGQRPPHIQTSGTVLTMDDCREIAAALAEQINERGDCDEVELRGLFLSFYGKISQEEETAYTGVEFLGDRESYALTRRHLDSIHLFGIFTEDGEEVTDVRIPELSVIKDLVNENLQTINL